MGYYLDSVASASLISKSSRYCQRREKPTCRRTLNKDVEPWWTVTELRRKKPLFRGFFAMHIERRYAQDGLLPGIQRLVIIHQNLCHFRTGEFRRGRNALTQHLAHLGT